MSTEVDVLDVGHMTIEDGRLKLEVEEGVTGADALDLDLSTVKRFHFERSGFSPDEGALVIETDEKRHVLPIATEDAADVVTALRELEAEEEGALGKHGDATPEGDNAITEDRDIVDGDFASAEDTDKFDAERTGE